MGKTVQAMKSTPAKGKVKKPLGKGSPSSSSKSPLGKGNSKVAVGKNSTKQPLRKGSPKAPLKNGKRSKAKPMKSNLKLKSKHLEKLGSMSLKDKVQKIAETAEDEEEAAGQLVEAMTPGEKSRGWSKHQTWLNKPGNEEERKEFQEASKNEKGQLTALFLMRKEAPRFCNVSRAVGTKQRAEAQGKVAV